MFADMRHYRAGMTCASDEVGLREPAAAVRSFAERFEHDGRDTIAGAAETPDGLEVIAQVVHETNRLSRLANGSGMRCNVALETATTDGAREHTTVTVDKQPGTRLTVRRALHTHERREREWRRRACGESRLSGAGEGIESGHQGDFSAGHTRSKGARPNFG